MLNKFGRVSSSVDAAIIASDIYDTSYGIYDHLRPGASQTKPLATVAMYDVEDLTEGNLKKALMRQYLDAKILTLFGYTFDEFIAHTREDIEMMIDESRRYRTAEATVNNSVVNDALKQINNMR